MIFKFWFFILAAYAITVFLAINIGSVGITWSNMDEISKTILFEIRAPRILLAVLMGALLSSSGLVVQSVFANPIADPYVIGIASSATFGAVLAYLLKLPDFYYGILGFACCVAFSLLIFSVSKRQNVTALLIIGIAASSFLGAFTTFAIYLIGEDSFKIVAWLMGYLGGASWERVIILSLPLIACLGYFHLKRFELDVLLSGDDEAKSLGVNPTKRKRNLLVATSLAVAFCVGFGGLIGFVGLIVPHAMRLIAKTGNHSVLLPMCACGGGIFLLVCDTFGRVILAPIEIPIGVITAFFGAPVFLWLAFRARVS